MKEWFVLAPEHEDGWQALAQEALTHVTARP
jgi:hypothetical protein